MRVAAALLLASSLAACSPSGGLGGSSIVSPLSQEVRRGLPTAPGRYALVNGTLGRDAQGVYYFAWRQPTDPSSAQNFAAVSRLRLSQAPTDALEIPTSGDPILYLSPNTAIPMVQSNEYQQTGGYYGSHTYWYPWYGGSYHGLGYYDPPTRTYSGGTGGTINGSTVSESPRSFAERTVGLSHAVSGRAGGTGSGTAATSKSGASFATSSSSHGGAAAAKSGSFSSGSAGASHASSS